MQLKTILHYDYAELLIPFEEPDCWPDSRLEHILAHVVGGAVRWLVWLLVTHGVGAGVLLALRMPDLARHVWFPGIAALIASYEQWQWEFMQQESDKTYPLWSVIWDAVTTMMTVIVLYGAFTLLFT